MNLSLSEYWFCFFGQIILGATFGKRRAIKILGVFFALAMTDSLASF
jgi:hypothetical protein